MPVHSANIERDESLEADLEAIWAEIEPPVVRRLMIAAVQEFAIHGYHGTTTRDIASRAGLSPAGVYVHFKSKEQLLYRISLVGHQRSLDVLAEAAASTNDPLARLRAVVSDFSSWHARYHMPAKVINYEIAALSEEHFLEIGTLRRRIDAAVRATLDDGVERGVFVIPDVGGMALALLSLAIDAGRWYRPGGQRTPAEIGTLFADLAERMVRP